MGVSFDEEQKYRKPCVVVAPGLVTAQVNQNRKGLNHICTGIDLLVEVVSTVGIRIPERGGIAPSR